MVLTKAMVPAEAEGPEERCWRRKYDIANTSKHTSAMHAKVMPTIAPVVKDLEGLATGAAVGVSVGVNVGVSVGVNVGVKVGENVGVNVELNVELTSAENFSTLIDPSPVIGSHPVVG